MYNILIISVLLISVVIGLYIYFENMYDKSSEVDIILHEHRCPKCGSEDISTFTKGHGCSGTMHLEIKCHHCGYTSIYTIPTSGGCSL